MALATIAKGHLETAPAIDDRVSNFQFMWAADWLNRQQHLMMNAIMPCHRKYLASYCRTFHTNLWAT